MDRSGAGAIFDLWEAEKVHTLVSPSYPPAKLISLPGRNALLWVSGFRRIIGNIKQKGVDL